MRRAPSEARTAVPEALTLRQLRHALRVTQTELARRLKKGQEVVSRVEQRHDMLLSTLRAYVSSLGGELELVCRFGNRAAVRLKTGIEGDGDTMAAASPVTPSATEIAMAVTAPFASRATVRGDVKDE